ncbi:MAG: leucyl/phenylalanyl-tRNA--protein transferase [Pseudomonadales bacterium]|jgi:leucyl/phenylalanyl-tRNA--protein transferase
MNLLSRQSPTFPPVERALDDPNGLLAVGGELNTEWLLAAYRHGIFPWFDSDASPILWWCPDPRAVIYPERVRITRSLAKRLRHGGFEVTADTAFAEVLKGCAAERRGRAGATGTWITTRMKRAYQALHELGFAHAIEVWRPAPDTGARELVGGLYGVSLGRMFFGESMFSRVPDASKVALCHLARQLIGWEFWLIDCQLTNPHLTRMGAEEMRRDEFIALVERNAHQPTRQGPWHLDPIDPASWQKQP